MHINIKGCRVVSPYMRLILVELREERKKKCTSRTRFIMRGVQIQAGWYSTYIETAVAMKITHLFVPYKNGAAVHQHYNQRLLTTKSHKIIHTQYPVHKHKLVTTSLSQLNAEKRPTALNNVHACAKCAKSSPLLITKQLITKYLPRNDSKRASLPFTLTLENSERAPLFTHTHINTHTFAQETIHT